MNQEVVSNAGNLVTCRGTTSVSSNTLLRALVTEYEDGYNILHVNWSPGIDSCKALLIKIFLNLVAEKKLPSFY
jgi:hypothetical protein